MNAEHVTLSERLLVSMRGCDILTTWQSLSCIAEHIRQPYLHTQSTEHCERIGQVAMIRLSRIILAWQLATVGVDGQLLTVD